VSQHVELTAIAVGHGELWTGRQRFQCINGLGCVPVGLGPAPDEPVQTGQPAQCVAFPEAFCGGSQIRGRNGEP